MVIVYASRVLEDRERRYNTTKKDMLAMVYGKTFTVRTDHYAFKWLQIFKEPEGKGNQVVRDACAVRLQD